MEISFLFDKLLKIFARGYKNSHIDLGKIKIFNEKNQNWYQELKLIKTEVPHLKN